MNIRFSKPYHTGKELTYIKDIIDNNMDGAGDGKYTKLVHEFLEKRYNVEKVFLTTSCTTALEFAVRLCDLKPGDEVIVPSFTFSSTVNAILLSEGLKVVFSEVTPDTLNIDPEDIRRKITKKTKAIIVVHYAGVACDMDPIMELAKKHKLFVIEDAAQAIESKYKGKYLGTIGDFGCLSFHDTKNITCGEGGALLINRNNKKIIEDAEIIREKGTNRTNFIRGVVDKYTWVNIGSSYLPSDLLAAYLYAQLEKVDEITKMRLSIFSFYKNLMVPFAKKGLVTIPSLPKFASGNGHIFFVLFNNTDDRNKVMDYCRSHGVAASFHYIPLHSAPQGRKLGYKKSDLEVTESASSRLLRFPLYAGMTKKEMQYISTTVQDAMALIMKKDITKQEKKFKKITIPYMPFSVKYSRTNTPFIQFSR